MTDLSMSCGAWLTRRALRRFALAAILVGGCRETPATVGARPDVTHVTLPAADCSGPPPAAHAIPLDPARVAAPVRLILPVLGREPTAAFVDASGLSVIALRTHGSVAPRRIATVGEGVDEIGVPVAIRADDGGGFTVLDTWNVRIVRVDSTGRVRSTLSIFPDVSHDQYALDLRDALAIASRPADSAYASTTASLLRRGANGSFVETGITFRTVARRVTGEGSDIHSGQRPLEQDPIVVPLSTGGVAINSTDSLEVSWSDARDDIRVVRGGGARVPITPAQRDSAVHEYGLRMLPSNPALPEANARRWLFVGRTQHQLIDGLLALGAEELAVRRTRACTDRQLWYRLRRDGTIGSTFSLPLDAIPLVATADTVFSATLEGGTLRLGWLALGPAAVAH